MEKEFGDFEIEKSYDRGVYLQKKCYFLFKDGKFCKGGFKGVNMRDGNSGKLYSKEELMDIKIGGIKLFKLEKNGKIVINNSG